jgi:signal peptidase I
MKTPIAATREVRQFLTTVLGVVMLGTVVVAAAALIVVPKAVGAKPLTVLTGSMQPALQPGDVAIVRPVDTQSLGVGDVITFQAESGNPQLTTHRVVGVVLTTDGVQYKTRGDANGAVDPVPIRPEQIKGAVWYSVPLVGYATTWVNGPTMTTVIQLVAFGLIIYGAFLLVAGALDRRSHKPEVAT